ncbi:MAG: hypothetical protein ACFFCS_15640, partial [Candidatus Hodarchaeota archaeon]
MDKGCYIVKTTEHSSKDRLIKDTPIKRTYLKKKKDKAVAVFIKKLSSSLKIPTKVTSKAIIVYEGTINKQLFQWREIKAIGGSCLYATCKMEGVPRSLSEFLGFFDGSDEKRFYECLKILS